LISVWEKKALDQMSKQALENQILSLKKVKKLFDDYRKLMIKIQRERYAFEVVVYDYFNLSSLLERASRTIETLEAESSSKKYTTTCFQNQATNTVTNSLTQSCPTLVVSSPRKTIKRTSTSCPVTESEKEKAEKENDKSKKEKREIKKDKDEKPKEKKKKHIFF
jgi:hypothetical protein